MYVGAVIGSDAQPTGVQLKREAKLLTVIGLTPLSMQTVALYLCYIQ